MLMAENGKKQGKGNDWHEIRLNIRSWLVRPEWILIVALACLAISLILVAVFPCGKNGYLEGGNCVRYGLVRGPLTLSDFFENVLFCWILFTPFLLFIFAISTKTPKRKCYKNLILKYLKKLKY